MQSHMQTERSKKNWSETQCTAELYRSINTINISSWGETSSTLFIRLDSLTCKKKHWRQMCAFAIFIGNFIPHSLESNRERAQASIYILNYLCKLCSVPPTLITDTHKMKLVQIVCKALSIQHLTGLQNIAVNNNSKTHTTSMTEKEIEVESAIQILIW